MKGEVIMEKVKIGGITYAVEQHDHLGADHGLCGQIHYEKAIIKIDSAMSSEKQEQTLVHEILHGIFHEAGFREQDEDQINRVANVLYQVMKDNQFDFKGGK